MAGTTISELGKMFNHTVCAGDRKQYPDHHWKSRFWFYDETVRKPSDSILCRD